MATCKDCIHEKACVEMLKAMGYTVNEDFRGSAERCDTFENKADVVEVVRCKDCKAYEAHLVAGGAGYCNVYYRMTPENEFCSLGETHENTRKTHECVYCMDEICVNADCPMCADYCPISDTPDVCKYEERTDTK